MKELKGLEIHPDFAETVELCFENGPPKLRKFSEWSKLIVNIFLCVTQLGFCCVYFVFASSSLKSVSSNSSIVSFFCAIEYIISLNHLQILDFYGFEVDIHLHMLFVLLPILLPSLIPNLKYLAPFSSVANVCMAVGIGVVFYYALQNVPAISERKYVGDLSSLPLFFGTAIYAFEGIALVSNIDSS